MSRPRGRRLAIVAHYSSSGSVDRAFEHTGAALADLGYDVMVATTAPTPLDDIAAALSPYAFAVVSRGNEGFDFQSWRRGLEASRRAGLDFDRLILTNGSMFGPMAPIEQILGRMDGFGSWGMTESMDFRRHIQSWWLAFGPAVLTHPQFYRFWDRVRPSTNKWGTILTHELTWSDQLALAGPTAVYVPVSAHGCLRNPLFFAWRELIRDWGLPFLKRSLLTHNYDHVDMTGWREFLADAVPGFDLSITEPDQ